MYHGVMARVRRTVLEAADSIYIYIVVVYGHGVYLCVCVWLWCAFVRVYICARVRLIVFLP